MGTSRIEYLAQPGTTPENWPVVTGCSNVPPISPGCENCWAARLAATRLRDHECYRGLATLADGRPAWSGEVRTWPEELERARRWRKPRTVFVAPMGDLFHPQVPVEFIAKVVNCAAELPQHTFLSLTKRPYRMLVWQDWSRVHQRQSGFSTNWWQGVTVCNQDEVLDIEELLEADAGRRWVSLEPLLGPVDIARWLSCEYCAQDLPFVYGHTMLHEVTPAGHMAQCTRYQPKLDLIILGGESGPHARPMPPGWARGVRDQVTAARAGEVAPGPPYLWFKQHGCWLHQSQDESMPRHHPVPFYSLHKWPDGSISYSVDKKAAGDLLDGRWWHEWPGKEID